MIKTTISNTDFNRYLREFSNSGHNINRVVWRQIKQDAIDKQTISVNIMNKYGYIPYIQFKKRNLVDKDYEGNDIAELVDYILKNEKNKLDVKEDMQNCVSNTTNSAINASITYNNITDTLNSVSNTIATTKTNTLDNSVWYTLKSSTDMSDYTTIKEKTNKENKNMMFNFDFGKVTSDAVRLSLYGIAVKSVNGNYVSYDPKSHSIMDVEIINMPVNGMLYKMPVAIKDIKAGDVIIHNKVPMFVVEVHESTVKVVDIREGAEKEIYPTKNIFGFNFMTKIVSMLDMSNTGANADNPFGNMLPFLMMSDNNKDIDPMMFMLMSGGKFDMSNPMMMYFMMKDGDKSSDMLPFMFMMMNNNSKSND